MSSTTTFAQLAADEQKRILDKLAKLKALSECRTGNVNATATAAATMTRIMLEYEIEMADLGNGADDQDDEAVNVDVYPEASANGYPAWKTTLLSAIADVNHCMSYVSRAPNLAIFWCNKSLTRLCLIGAPKDIESTRRLYHFCVDEIERLCSDWGVGQSVKRKNDFKRGAACGIAGKIREERDRVLREEEQRAHTAGRSSTALDLFDRKERAVGAVAAKIGMTYKRSRRPRVFMDAYHAGYEAGASMSLSGAGRPRLSQG